MSIKIVALIRTYNEARNIEACCKAYSEFADAVLVADGGSTDNTVAIAKTFPKVQVRDYPVKVECANGIWRNPDGPHLNFLYQWGEEEGADWIVSQDCDQRPNFFLKRDVRTIMENTARDFLMVTQIFLWHEKFYFPNMSKTDTVYPHLPNLSGKWSHGIWAWRANLHVRAIDKMPHYEFTIDGTHSILPETLEMDETLDCPPYCFLHHGWPDDEKVEAMVQYYRKSKLIPVQAYPLAFCGPFCPIDETLMIE